MRLFVIGVIVLSSTELYAQCSQELRCPTSEGTIELTRERGGISNARAQQASQLLSEALHVHESATPGHGAVDRTKLTRASALYAQILREYDDLDRLDLSALPARLTPPTRTGVQRYRAEALWQLQRFEECAQVTTAMLSSNRRPSEDLAYLDVICHESARRTNSEFDSTPALQRSVCAFPDTDYGTNARVQLAQRLIDQQRFAEAATQAEYVVRSHPEHDLALDAGLAWLTALARDACAEPLAAAIPLAEQQFCPANDELCEVIPRLRCTMLRKQAEAVAQTDPRAAAARYGAMVERQCEDPDVNLYNQAVMLAAAGELDEATAIRTRLIEQVPESQFAMRALWQNAEAHESVGRYVDAANDYATYARRFPGEDNAAEGLERAIYLRMSVASQREVRTLVELFERNYGRRLREQTGAILASFARYLEEQGQARQASRVLTRLLESFESSVQRVETLVALSRVDAPHAGAHLDRAIVIGQGLQLTNPLERHRLAEAMSEARFRRAEMARATWERRRNPEQVSEVEALYNQVAEHESPRWMIASARRLGDMHAAINSTRARDLYEFCFVTMVRTRAVSEHGQACGERLTEIDSETYPPFDELLGMPAQRGGAPPGPVTDANSAQRHAEHPTGVASDE